MPVTPEQLVRMKEVAKQQYDRAYAPYSNYNVGAAVLTEDGAIVGGCNVECCVFPLGNCAEVVALSNAVSQGQRRFKAIAVMTGTRAPAWPTPCGSCRQMMAEFNPELEVFLVRTSGEHKETSVRKLLPDLFSPKELA